MQSKQTILAVIFALLLIPIASADVIDPFNPTPYHPSYETSSLFISANYDDKPLKEDFYVEVLMCYDEPHAFQGPEELNLSIFDSEKNCYWTSSYLQYEYCSPDNCDFLFRYPRDKVYEDAKFALFIPELNKTFVSDNFTLQSVNSYRLNFLPNGTLEMFEIWVDWVDPDSNPAVDSTFLEIVLPFFLTFVIELLAAFLFLRAKKIKKKKIILGFVFLANLISWPLAYVMFIFGLIFLGVLLPFLITEFLVVVFEGYFIHWTNKKSLNLKKSFWLSIVMNVSSIIAGLIIFAIIYGI